MSKFISSDRFEDLVQRHFPLRPDVKPSSTTGLVRGAQPFTVGVCARVSGSVALPARGPARRLFGIRARPVNSRAGSASAREGAFEIDNAVFTNRDQLAERIEVEKLLA